MKKLILLGLVLLSTYTHSLAQTNQKKSDDTIHVFYAVEVLPEPREGMYAWVKYISQNLKYPTLARKNKIKGKVVLEFTIDNDGSLTNVKVLEGIGGGCDEEAVRILSESPKWWPAIQNGKTIPVLRTIAIKFPRDRRDPIDWIYNKN